MTGGSRGIGAAIARRLAREGAAVAITYVSSPDKAQAVAKEIDADGGRVLVIQAAALIGLTKGLARDLGPRGITATLIHAGLIDTDMNPADSPYAEQLRAVPALGEFGTAEDIAATVAHFAGPGGRYITGTAISVDGGFAA